MDLLPSIWVRVALIIYWTALEGHFTEEKNLSCFLVLRFLIQQFLHLLTKTFAFFAVITSAVGSILKGLKYTQQPQDVKKPKPRQPWKGAGLAFGWAGARPIGLTS